MEILPEPQHAPQFMPGMKPVCSPVPSSVCSLGAGGVRALGLPLDTQTAAHRRAWDSDPSAAAMPYPGMVWETGNVRMYRVKKEAGNRVRETMLIKGQDMQTVGNIFLIAY